jgi:hypothetical protein
MARLQMVYECSESWESMAEKAPHVRWCRRCEQEVTDVTGMTEGQIATLFATRETAPPCLRMLAPPHAEESQGETWWQQLAIVVFLAGILASAVNLAAWGETLIAIVSGSSVPPANAPGRATCIGRCVY